MPPHSSLLVVAHISYMASSSISFLISFPCSTEKLESRVLLEGVCKGLGLLSATVVD
jgi:hypothetical protein